MERQTDLKSVPMSEALMHYGVKGMKWGVRKDGKPQGYSSRHDNVEGLNRRFVDEIKSAPAKDRNTIVKEVDGEWLDIVLTDQDWFKSSLDLADKQFKKNIKQVNKTYKKKDMTDESVRQEYANNVSEAITDSLDYGSLKGYGTSPSGMHRVVVEPIVDAPGAYNAYTTLRMNDLVEYDLDTIKESDRSKKAAKHSNEEDVYVRIPLKLDVDSDGLVVGFKAELDKAKQSKGPELKHYGVKGMKWGVRKSRSAKYLDRAEKGGSKKRKNKLTPAQKERIKKAKIKAKADVKVAKLNAKTKKIEARGKLESAKAKAEAPKKKPISAMTNQELQEIINRNRLETEYKKITEVPKKKTTSDKIVEFALKQGTKGVERASGALINHIVDTQMKKVLGDSHKPDDKKKKDKS